MCQLVPLSITVMLKDIVFQGGKRGKIDGGARHHQAYAPLFIVNGGYTDTKHLIRGTHIFGAVDVAEGGLHYGAELHNP